MLCKWKLFLLFRLKKFEAQTKCEINLKITPTWSKGKTHQYCSRRLSSSTSDMAIERVVELPEPFQVTPEKRKETPKKRKQIHAEPNKPGRFVVAVSVANQITFAFASGVATKPPYKIIRLRILGPPMVFVYTTRRKKN